MCMVISKQFLLFRALAVVMNGEDPVSALRGGISDLQEHSCRTEDTRWAGRGKFLGER